MAKQEHNFSLLNDTQSVINTMPSLFSDEPPIELFYKKQNMQDYVDYAEHNEKLDNFCYKCKGVIDDDNGFMQCCPDKGYLDRWMDCKAIYVPRRFHIFCRGCFVDYVKNVSQDDSNFTADGIPCMAKDCKYKFNYIEGCNRWSYEMEKFLFGFVFQKNLIVPGMKAFTCKSCSYKTLVPDGPVFYSCKNCRTYVCLGCYRPVTQAHELLSCEKMNEYEVESKPYFVIYNSMYLKSPRQVLIEL